MLKNYKINTITNRVKENAIKSKGTTMRGHCASTFKPGRVQVAPLLP